MEGIGFWKGYVFIGIIWLKDGLINECDSFWFSEKNKMIVNSM